MLYDPQGVKFSVPTTPIDELYVPDRPESLRVTLIGIAAILVAVGAWYASITVVSWIVIAVAGFLALMAGYTLYVYAPEASRLVETTRRIVGGAPASGTCACGSSSRRASRSPAL